jgi:hypothetical protein
MTTTTPTIIPLDGAYHREYLAHILAWCAAGLMEETTVGTANEPPSFDTMITQGLVATVEPYLERLERLAAIADALRVILDENNDSLEWPATELAALTSRTISPLLNLREALGSLPAEQLSALVDAVGPAEALEDLIRDEVTA